jgi:hypothetical protein
MAQAQAMFDSLNAPSKPDAPAEKKPDLQFRFSSFGSRCSIHRLSAKRAKLFQLQSLLVAATSSRRNPFKHGSCRT